jgi:aminodeoxyfutalosine synthase
MLKALSALNDEMGGTGNLPVPSGNLPDGTSGAVQRGESVPTANQPHAIPVGRLPTGAGKLPAPPKQRLHLKCFTAIEILHLAWLAKKSVEQTLAELKEAGLASLTGGGAEIFQKEVRSAIAKGKESAEEYLDVHRTWHRMGGRSTCTMLYGHVESLADRVDHLRQLRALQDETHGFVGFVPLAYQPDNNNIPVKNPPTGFDSLRTIAVSRIYLDNFEHITAYWVGLGMKLAQVALSYGADDLHGTIIEEHIFHMAGAKSPQLQTEAEMVKAIREAGRVPVQRGTFYEPIKVWDDVPTATDAEPAVGKSKVLERNLATA